MKKSYMMVLPVILSLILLPVLQGQIVNDADGNEYNTVTIGTQVWMTENLKTTSYSDGTALPNVTGNDEWADISAPAYCRYNNDVDNSLIYGALYNWFAIDGKSNGGKNLCPEGWHVPTDDDWVILLRFLYNNGYGFEDDRRSVAKSLAASSGWKAHNIAGNVGTDQEINNRTGFTALPAGYRNFRGEFNYLGSYSYWWTSTENSGLKARYIFIHNYYNYVGKGDFRKQNGFSIRCLQN